MSVGVGNPHKLEESLYTPLLKSVETGHPWTMLLLLPSVDSAEHAEVVKARVLANGWTDVVQVAPLSKGQESSVDDCYEHFEQAIFDRLAKARLTGMPVGLVVDFTRGTKAMSAALMMAAMRHDATSVRYIDGQRESGTVKAGTERVLSGHPSYAAAQRVLDRALQLMAHGNYAAVLDVVPDPDAPFALPIWKQRLQTEAKNIRSLAEFYSAWDRLQWQKAAELAGPLPTIELPDHWDRFAVSPSARNWVMQLANISSSSAFQKRAQDARRIIVDLWQNGQRRVQQGQYEDAFVRAYRILELIGQARLFDQGLDSAHVSTSEAFVGDFIELLESKRRYPPYPKGKKGYQYYEFSREMVCVFLEWRGDQFGSKLLRTASANKIDNRNISILNHGLAATGPENKDQLIKIYLTIKDLIIKDNPQHGEDWLSITKFPLDAR